MTNGEKSNKGWKTYTVGGLTVITAIIGRIYNVIEVDAMITMLGLGLGIMGLRHAIEKI